MPTYTELLKNVEWIVKRNKIVLRDENMCQNCFNKKYLDYSLSTFSLIHNKEITILVLNNDENSHVYINYDISFLKELNTIKNKAVMTVYDFTSSGFINIIGFITADIKIAEKEVDDEIEERITMQAASLSPDITVQKALKLYISKVRPYSVEQKQIIRSKLLERKIKSITPNLNSFGLTWNDMKNLQVHHKYYQSNKLPWDYPDEALVTLCWDCHEELHKGQKVLWLDENHNEIGYLEPCLRCYGAGVFPEYGHIQSGICFRCNGLKYEDFI